MAYLFYLLRVMLPLWPWQKRKAGSRPCLNTFHVRAFIRTYLENLLGWGGGVGFAL
jgi:hypothetical protein